MKNRNPARGVRGHRLRSTRPAWGVSSLATGRTGADLLRGLLANPVAANSSTMRGPQGLAGELCRRRCQTANDLSRWVRGCSYARSPEMIVMRSEMTRDRNYAGSGELDIRLASLPVTRDSDVSYAVKVMTNAGSSVAAGVVLGAWLGRSGDSNAVEWECGLSRKPEAVLAGAKADSGRCSLQGSGDSFVRSGWCRTYTTTKGLTGSMYLSLILY